MMKSAYRNIFLLFGLLAIVIMLCTFDIDYRELWENIHRAGYWFFAVVGVWVVIYFCNALSWYYIIKSGEEKSPVPFWRVYKLSISGFALNYATPCGLMGGEPYRIMELAPYVGTSRATSSVILYVMMHIFSHICFWLGAIVLYLCMYRVGSVPMGVFLSVTGAVLLLLVYFFIRGYRNGMVVRTIRILRKIPFVGRWFSRFYESKREVLQRIDSQIAGLHRQRRRTFYASFLTEFVSRVLTSAEVFFILKILTPDVSFLDCILIMAFTSLFSNIFFFSPMQLGAREGGFALAVSGLSLSGAFGVYTSLISRVRELIWIAIGVALMKVGNGKVPACGGKKPVLDGVRGLLFDYGGTLDSGGRHWSRIIWESYLRAEVPVTEERFREAYVYAERYLGKHHVIEPEDTFRDLMRKKIHLEMQYLELPSACEEAVVSYCYDYAVRETEKSRRVLETLRGRYAMVLVTNFYGNIHSVLADFGLQDIFEDVIESAVVGVRKPSPEIWRKGVEALRLPAAEVCAIGDSFDKDIEPARSLGCRAVWFKGEEWSPSVRDESAADAVITDITQLLSL